MFQLTHGEPKTLRAEITRAGQPARVEGVPVWSSSNPAVLTVTPAADGLTAVVTSVAPGEAEVTLTASAGGAPLAAPPFAVAVSLPLADALAIAPA
jgi:uncharacterized protein YjdB